MKQEFIKLYKPLVIDFLKEIKNIKINGLPEPFLPAIGKNYEKAKYKITFTGMETRGYGELKNFIEHANKNIEDAICRIQEEFDNLDFCDWGNNFGTSFWDFNLKFLSYFYNLDDWLILKNKEKEDILTSFSWCNINSIERFEVTSEGNGANYENWSVLKEASKVFDNGKLILNSLKPDILIILHWADDESWLFGNSDIKPEVIEDHLWYYFIENTQTHVIWTAHPRWLNMNKEFDNFIETCVNVIKQKIK